MVVPRPHPPPHALVDTSVRALWLIRFVRLSDRLRTSLRQGHERLLDGGYERLWI